MTDEREALQGKRYMLYAPDAADAPDRIWAEMSVERDSAGAFDHEIEDVHLDRPDLEFMPIEYVRFDLHAAERGSQNMRSDNADEMSELAAELTRLTAERDALREALIAATGGLEWASGILPSEQARSNAWEMAEAARAALKGET